MNMRASSISPASRKAPARCGPPSSRSDWTSRAPSSSSACSTRAASFSPVATITSTPAASRACTEVRDGGARADDDQRHVGHALHELRVERKARLGVEHDAARLARDALDAGGEARVVDERGADAHGHGVGLRPPAVRAGAAGLAGDPLGVAGAGRDLAVERHRRLEDHERAAGAGVLAEGLVQHPGGLADLAVDELDPDALVAQDPRAAAGGLGGRIVGGDHHARDPGRRRSRRCTAACGRGGSTARATRTWSRRRCARRPPRAP